MLGTDFWSRQSYARRETPLAEERWGIYNAWTVNNIIWAQYGDFNVNVGQPTTTAMAQLFLHQTRRPVWYKLLSSVATVRHISFNATLFTYARFNQASRLSFVIAMRDHVLQTVSDAIRLRNSCNVLTLVDSIVRCDALSDGEEYAGKESMIHGRL